jgi:hypothetical protein
MSNVTYISSDCLRIPTIFSEYKFDPSSLVSLSLFALLKFELNMELSSVVALYDRRPLITAVLVTGVVVEFLNAVAWGVWISQNVEMQGACMVKSVPKTGAYLL